MKKLMIAAAIVCAAVMAQASAFDWASKSSGSTGKLYDGTADNLAYTTYGGVTLYLFDAATYAQEDAFKDLVDGKFQTGKAVDSTTLSSASKIAQTEEFSYGTTGSTYSFYFAAIMDSDPNTFYISSMKTDQKALESGSTSMEWNDLNSTSKSLLDASEGFKGAGMYTAVPEPTSGLLLLLGVAGMALRRRRA